LTDLHDMINIYRMSIIPKMFVIAKQK